MLNDLFGSILTTDTAAISTFSITSFMLCTICSLTLGMIIAIIYMYKNTYSKNFVITVALLPAIIQMIIMLVNGNLGTGVAVMGAFSLIRFRSAPGKAKEICSIFIAMAVGLATGMGYIAMAILFTTIIGIASIAYSMLGFGDLNSREKDLKITIPEGLNYTGVFDDLFKKYSNKSELVEVKTSNMGSLYKLHYKIILKNEEIEKEFLDELRCRNGNLEILCQRAAFGGEEL